MRRASVALSFQEKYTGFIFLTTYMESISSSEFLAALETDRQKETEPLPQEWVDGVRRIEEKTRAGEHVDPVVFDQTRIISLSKKGRGTIDAEQSLRFTGNGFEFSLKAEGVKIASMRYGVSGDVFSMGKTDVDESYQGFGINTQLFQDMSDLHPGADTVWTKFDGTNTEEYISGLQSGLDRFSAADTTPAGKVRRRSGWEIDREQSSLPDFTDGYGLHAVGNPEADHRGGIRVVYTRRK